MITAPRSLSYYGAVPDLGLAYVAASVRGAGHDVSVIDAAGEDLDAVRPWPTEVGELARQGLDIGEILERIPDDVQVIGFANMFLHEWGLLKRLIAAAKRARPGAVVLAGGENATAYALEMLAECPELDACVCGEGEAPMRELLGRLEATGSIADAPSLAVRRNGVPEFTPRVARTRELDALPPPAWDLFPIERYLERGLGSGVDRGRAMPILTSRGCPYQCTFCSSPSMWTTRYYRRDPERVLDEIEGYQARYGIDNVNINDLTSLLTKAWILEFCAAIERRGLRFTWQLPSGTRSEAVDAEAARAMQRAGCRNFCYAPESGSTSELKRIKKRVRLPALRGSLRDALQAGLVTQASIIVGLPGQRRDELLDTWRFTQRLALDGLHTLGVMVFAPYPGSETYADLVGTGAIVHDDAYRYGSLLRSVGAGRSYHGRWSRRRLAAVQLAMLASFYVTQYARRPGRAWRVAANVLRGREETVMEKFVTTKARQLFRRSAFASMMG